MSRLELIQSLITQHRRLHRGNDSMLDALKRRTKMMIRKIFGDSSEYLKDLNNIDFYLPIASEDDHFDDEQWNSGSNEMLNLLRIMLEDVKLSEADKDFSGNETVRSLTKIFIVHGHDEEMKQSVARVLEFLDLDPIILHERPDQGRTIIEKIEDYSDVGYAVICLSPDDMGYEKNKPPNKAQPRARQNVILELGFFIGKLGRDHVLAIYKGDDTFEFPSDYSGVIYTPFDESGGWKMKTARELQACGYSVDANDLL